MTWKQGAREGKGRAQRQDRGRSSLERLRRPVRDQGGIKAGPRRDHLLFNLILTDYQLPTASFFFSYFFELQALALYQSLIRDTEQATGGDLLYWPRPERPTARPGPLSFCKRCCKRCCEGCCEGCCDGLCEGFCEGSCVRCCCAY